MAHLCYLVGGPGRRSLSFGRFLGVVCFPTLAYPGTIAQVLCHGYTGFLLLNIEISQVTAPDPFHTRSAELETQGRTKGTSETTRLPSPLFFLPYSYFTWNF